VWTLHLRSPLKLAEVRALQPFESIGPLSLPSPDEFPEELYPQLMGSEPATPEQGDEPLVNGGGKPMNANGDDDSELPEQRDFWIAATNKGLTRLGGRRLIANMFARSRTRDLTTEQCLAATGAVNELTEEQVREWNIEESPKQAPPAETTEEAEPEPETEGAPGRENLLSTIRDRVKALDWTDAKLIFRVYNTTKKNSLTECSEDELSRVLDAIDSEGSNGKE